MAYGSTRLLGLSFCLMASMLLAACGGGASVSPVSGGFKIGDPYQINGRWYYPADDPSYNETGIASWYGEQFQGRRTANGERFDMNLISAAHPTLPLPTHARVTNLENGRSIVVRINDRGPFANGRIIDLSRAAAQALGFERAGTVPVRVQNIGRAPLNVASNAAQNVLNGRRTRSVAAESTTVMAAAISPPGQGLEPVASGPAVNVNAPREPHPDRNITRPPRIFVQVGAFGIETNAVAMLSRLQGPGNIANAMIEPAWVVGQQLYRVRVGPFRDVDEADGALQRVANLGYHAARIIVD